MPPMPVLCPVKVLTINRELGGDQTSLSPGPQRPCRQNIQQEGRPWVGVGTWLPALSHSSAGPGWSLDGHCFPPDQPSGHASGQHTPSSTFWTSLAYPWFWGSPDSGPTIPILTGRHARVGPSLQPHLLQAGQPLWDAPSRQPRGCRPGGVPQDYHDLYLVSHIYHTDL